MPLHELRRRARSNSDKQAQALYKLLAFQSSLKIFIWLVGTISGSVLLIFLAHISGWLVLAFVLSISWLLFDDRFSVSPGGWLWRISSFVAPVILPVVNFLQPLFGRAPGHLGRPTAHSGVYEKEDLLELLHHQSGQIDNRIPEIQLKAARGALSFGDKTVLSIMTPRKKVVWVNGADSIGPKLMDDLHKTGFIRFPVIAGGSKPTNPEVIGSLYLTDLLKHLEKSGKVQDIMKKDAHFINESDSLLQALDGFLKAGQHLLIVVNNFEEVVGALTLDDVLSQILGQKISDEFDRYDDLRSVAGHEPKDRILPK